MNEQVKKSYYGLTVNALRLVVTTKNSLGVAVGTTATISSAASQLSNPVAGVVAGYAYGTQAQIGTTFDSGPSFVIYMPCHGTANAVRSNSGSSVNIPGIATAGTIVNTVKGRVATPTTTAETTSTIQTANVLQGVVTATAIKSVSRGSTDGSTYTFNDTGSSFGTISIQGNQIDPGAAPGTAVEVPGVGTVTLRKVSRTSKSISVSMIEVLLKQPVGNLPIGTVVRVGVSKVVLS